MEDDDEFGDLYTDVLRPFAASFQAPNQETDAPPAGGSSAPSSHSRSIDLNKNSDDEEILYGTSDLKNSNSNSNPSTVAGFNLNVTVKEHTLPEPDIRHERRREFDLNLDFTSEGLVGSEGRDSELEDRVLEKDVGVELKPKASNLIEGDDADMHIVVEEKDNEDDDLLRKDDNFIDNNTDMHNSAAQEKNTFNIVKESEMGSEQKLDNPRNSNFEDEWDSEDSEDDLQIVLNDNDHGQLGVQGVDDDDEEALVIVADSGDEGFHRNPQMMMEVQQWGGEEGGPSEDRERKEPGDVTKLSVAGGATSQVALQPKVGYINHAYHQSQFKYVRPGAAPVPGAAPGGIPGHVRPPFPAGPLPGRGRGDWRPAGMKGDMLKGFHPPGYGIPPWGTNTSGRGGLDFTLPSHKTIFEVDIDSFEEKPWKLPGIDMSDFFNFGMNEESWKDYRKQLEQLRLGTTMQNKIRVYEYGRAEQDYDPDLPPELAAAVSGNQDHISSESANPRNVNVVPTDSAIVHGRPPLPVGRPIPVEISSGDRLPSIDTRRQRMHDTDAIIEVVCHSSKDDEDNVSIEVDIGGGDEIGDHQDDEVEHTEIISHTHNGRKKETVVAKRGYSKHSSPEVTEQKQPDGEKVDPHDHSRSAKGGERGERSPKMSARDNERRETPMNNEDEESFDSGNNKQSPRPLSSSRTIGSDGEQPVIARDDSDDNKSDRSFDTEQDNVVVDESSLEGKQLLTSQENSKDSRSKARSGSSKDYLKLRDSEDEVLQNRRPPRAGNGKIPARDKEYDRKRVHHERDVTARKHMSVKTREDSYSRESGDPNILLRRHMKGESGDWRKESDVSEGNWHWRDRDRHGKWNRVEETGKADHGGEIPSRNRIKARESEKTAKEEYHQSRNMMDNGSWRDRDTGSKQRDRDQSVKSLSGKADDIQNKKRKDVAYVSREDVSKEDISHIHRENSTRRKRERDDVSDQWKRDEQSLQRERNDRERERDEWHRLKPTPEEFVRREREETRPMMRSGRATTEEKAWNSHSRRKDDYKGSSKEYHPSVMRHNDQLNRRDRVESVSFSQNRAGREDIYARGNQPGNDEKRPIYERSGSRNDRAASHAYDNSRAHEHKQKESRRKGKDSESSLVAFKRNSDEQGGQTSQMVKSRGRSERGSGENKTQTNRQFPKEQHKENDASSDEENSRKGRSKLERWTSNKERDFTATTTINKEQDFTATTTIPSPLKINKDFDFDTIPNNEPPLVNGLYEEPPKKEEDKPQILVDDKDATGTEKNVNDKVMEDKHLDTVEKLKKRSERFKLPMPIEKDTSAIKKMESGPLPSAQTETALVTEIKPERPARKRRWAGN